MWLEVYSVVVARPCLADWGCVLENQIYVFAFQGANVKRFSLLMAIKNGNRQLPPRCYYCTLSSMSPSSSSSTSSSSSSCFYTTAIQPQYHPTQCPLPCLPFVAGTVWWCCCFPSFKRTFRLHLFTFWIHYIPINAAAARR